MVVLAVPSLRLQKVVQTCHRSGAHRHIAVFKKFSSHSFRERLSLFAVNGKLRKGSCLLCLVLSTLLLHQVSSTQITSIRKKFNWKSNIDYRTGLASSMEQSSVFVSKNVRIQRISRDMVTTWPDFICKGSVTLGLFEVKRDQRLLGTSIRPRFVPINLLSFGMVRRLIQGPKCFHWEIPIRGGLLALPTDKDNKVFGKLTFSVAKEQSNYRLTTQIVGYRPWLAGTRPSIVRQRLYLSTQSVLHAYIMWRFHRTWQTELQVGVI
jgi:hypothetical protein